MHEKSLNEKLEDIREQEEYIFDLSCFDNVTKSTSYAPFFSCIDLENPSEEDIHSLRLLVENQILELQEKDLQKAQEDFERQQLLDQIIELEEKIGRIEEAKSKAAVKFRTLVEGLEEYENQQELNSQ